MARCHRRWLVRWCCVPDQKVLLFAVLFGSWILFFKSCAFVARLLVVPTTTDVQRNVTAIYPPAADPSMSMPSEHTFITVPNRCTACTALSARASPLTSVLSWEGTHTPHLSGRHVHMWIGEWASLSPTHTRGRSSLLARSCGAAAISGVCGRLSSSCCLPASSPARHLLVASSISFSGLGEQRNCICTLPSCSFDGYTHPHVQ